MMTAIVQPTLPFWMILPFIALLLMIATGPLFYERYWEKNYPKIVGLLASIVVGYYVFILHNVHKPMEALAEYIQFMALIAALYIISGGIVIEINKKATPWANVTLLLTGALIANLVGTTGASMLLIRPYIRLNKGRIKPYHIVFFIFMVSNVGGALTPIGDPPLFLGFLKGVPFFWTFLHNIGPWWVVLLLLSGIFYVFDTRNSSTNNEAEAPTHYNHGVAFRIAGSKNFIGLAVVIAAVFLDPNICSWVPALHYHGHAFSFLREMIMLGVAFVCYRCANKQVLADNQFNFEPIKEVAFIFIGIFSTMMPALALVGDFAQCELGKAHITPNTLYWSTGMLSSFLDNAPTYLNCLAASMASHGGNIMNIADVHAYAMGNFPDSILHLEAIATASVFFGAMTYIGNGPNFMVRAIAEQAGIHMPSFFVYMIRFSIPFLLPALIIVWLVFFAFI